jgi:hypothetical protein
MSFSDLDNVPEELARKAFRHGEEMAWTQDDCPAVIEWLRDSGCAVLGTELWRRSRSDPRWIATAIDTRPGPTIYCTACDPLKGERWSEYVERSAKEAIRWISLFRWPEDSTEPPTPVYFNITWANRKWFREHSRADFADE